MSRLKFGRSNLALSSYVFFGFQEEFCYPVECLALTVEEVMHIRQVLVKAELEKYQQYKDVYTALKKGKVWLSPQRCPSFSREVGHTSLPFARSSR